jgi:transposase
VHRYNAEGIEGLKSGHGPGKPPSLTGEQMAELKATVLQGPDPEQHGVVRWRCVDLRAEVARRFTVEVSERTIGKWLRKLELTRLQPRPSHPKKMRRPRRSVHAVTGYHINALDGEIGHDKDMLVEDADWSIHYLVVDTTNWWPGKKVLISPASARHQLVGQTCEPGRRSPEGQKQPRL